jgi:hypothetical protein
MSRDKESASGISKARTPGEIGDFWDSHSLADHWDQTREVELEVTALPRRRVTLDPTVYTEIEAQARARGLMLETLVNLWLAERLHQT